MPRKKAEEPSMSSYFRDIFKAEPKLLKIRDNRALRERWESDHPGKEFTKNISQALANVKSIMRKSRKKYAPKKAESGNGAALKPAPTLATHAALERLEVSIDHCLSTARQLDSQGLDRAIKLLRAARNEIVWKSGQP